MSGSGVTLCHDCDAVCEQLSVGPGEIGRCPRCRASLIEAPRGQLDTALALGLTGCVLVVVLNAFPLLSLKFQSAERETTLVGAALDMWHHDMRLVALLVLVTTVVAPAVQIGLQTYLLWQVRTQPDWRAVSPPLRWLHHLRPWSMAEVFMLGLLVSLVKVRDLADIVLGPAFWSCVAVIFIGAALNARVDADSVWAWHRDRADAP
ncbi:MAG: paraquat-inducible protein A [Pseudomonadota bacterium]